MTSSKRSFTELSDGQDDPSVRHREKRRLEYATLSLTSGTDASPAPPFQQPFQLLSFSYTSFPSTEDATKRMRTLEWNDSSMKYFVPPPQSADLAYGYQRWIKRPEERGRLDGLLEACLRSECEGERGRAGVITWRGVITKILTAPYEDRDGWDLNVMCVNDTLYLEEHLSDDKLQEKSNLSGKQRLMTYYGYAFESYCTSDTPTRRQLSDGKEPANGWGGDVDTNVQWCSVVKTKLGSIRMVIGGEVDCVRGRNTGQPDTFVELKTSIEIRPGNKIDEAKFEKKLLKFYFQSFLLGVPEIIVGFRTRSGYLQKVQSFKTMELPRKVRGRPGAWDPAVCLAWGVRVFDFFRDQTCGNDNENSVWRVRFMPGVGLTMRRLDHTDASDVTAGEDRVGFLPQWYLERVQRPVGFRSDNSAPVVMDGAAPVAARTGDSHTEKMAIHVSSEAPASNPSIASSTQKLQGWQV